MKQETKQITLTELAKLAFELPVGGDIQFSCREDANFWAIQKRQILDGPLLIVGSYGGGSTYTLDIQIDNCLEATEEFLTRVLIDDAGDEVFVEVGSKDSRGLPEGSIVTRLLPSGHIETYDNLTGCFDVHQLSRFNEAQIHKLLAEYDALCNSNRILEQKQDSRGYIDIAFSYKDKLYVERIHLNAIDPNHYDGMWDYWFGSEEGDDVGVTFEVTAAKGQEGQFLTDNMYVNVYSDPDSDPILVITDIKRRQSWINRKSFI